MNSLNRIQNLLDTDSFHGWLDEMFLVGGKVSRKILAREIRRTGKFSAKVISTATKKISKIIQKRVDTHIQL